MKVGTKSVLFGAHCFLIHPIFVAIAWKKLYGWTWDIRHWIAFFVHDLGYWGKPNMDGPEGETHPEFGANLMHKWFDGKPVKLKSRFGCFYTQSYKWYNFCYYHSRFLAKKNNHPYSKLCVADKLAVTLEPSWLYLPRVNWSKEIKEYMKLDGKEKYEGEPTNKYENMALSTESQDEWFKAMTSYLRRWAEEHKDGKFDSWTPGL